MRCRYHQPRRKRSRCRLVNTLTTRGALFALVAVWRLPWRAVWTSSTELVGASLISTFVVTSCVGAAMADQAARQALRLVGDTSFIGLEYLTLGIEQFGALLVALALAQRVGAGFAAQIATEQSEDTLRALLLFGCEPMRTRVAPMGVALVVGCVALSLVGVLAWELAGMLALGLRLHTNAFTFFRPEAISASSLALLATKSVVFGLVVFVASTSAGLQAGQGAHEVGLAATRAVVWSVVACLLLGFAVDIVWLLLRSL